MKAFFAFAGQGAQRLGMGKDFYAGSEAAATVFESADAALGWSVSELCFEGPEEKLTESRFCQPAIFTVSMACLAAFRERCPDIVPAVVAGLSLGEFAALCAAEVFSFEDAVSLVSRRGDLMDEACRQTDGSMASVLGGDPELVASVCAEHDVDLANFNCPGQIVISGEKDKVSRAVAAMKEEGLRKVIPLKVAGAYHSRLMNSAGEKLRKELEDIPMNPPEVPVAQNYTGNLVRKDTKKAVALIRENLVRQVAGSVRWEQCVASALSTGAEIMVEFGPGNVISGLMKRINKAFPSANVENPESLEQAAGILGETH